MTQFESPFWTDRATLYSTPESMEGHRIRFLLAEKQAPVNISILGKYIPEALDNINPSHHWPLLTDKLLALWSTTAIEQYIMDRFPEPRIMPHDPVARALLRQGVSELRGWYNDDFSDLKKVRARVEELIYLRVGIWIAGDEFTLLDIAVAPWLWRALKVLNVKQSTATGFSAYTKRLFSRPSFVNSLTPEEREYRQEAA